MRIGHTHGGGHSWEFIIFLLVLLAVIVLSVVIKNVLDND